MEAVATLEPWEARLLTALDTPKERLIGLVQSRQHVLQDMGMDGRVLWEHLTDRFQLRFLLIA